MPLLLLALALLPPLHPLFGLLLNCLLLSRSDGVDSFDTVNELGLNFKFLHIQVFLEPFNSSEAGQFNLQDVPSI